MAQITWSTLADGQVVVFNPLVDELRFDDLAISAAGIVLDLSTGTTSVFSFGGKTVTVNTAPTTLTSSNVTFADGSLLLVGDNKISTANDGGNNTLTGGGGDDQLLGLGGNDTLKGGAGDDMLNGGLGNDTLIGGAGEDSQQGGDGNDVFLFAVGDSGPGESVVGGAGTDALRFTATSGTLQLFGPVDVESVAIATAAGAMTGTTAVNLDASGVTNGLSIIGNNGANQLTGTDFADTLIGKAGADTLIGGNDNDTLRGGGGRDNVQGGAGDDVVQLASAAEFATGELIDGGADIDTLRYTSTLAGTLTLTANVTNIERVELANAAGLTTGLAAINVNAAAVANGLTIVGNNGTNVLTGTAFADTLIGNAGNDTLIWDPIDASVGGGASTDKLKITGGEVHLDLTAVPDDVITDIEVINLTGSGNNRLTLAHTDVLALSSTTDTLRVDGNAGDVVVTTDQGWLRLVNNITIGAQTYAQYLKSGALLQVDTDITRAAIATIPPLTTIDLSALDGTNGFQLSGETAGDQSGFSVSAAGDVNGDGFADLLIGALSADPNGEGSGASYVVFGNTTAALDALHGAAGFNLSNLDGNNGFQLSGAAEFDRSGLSVSSAGDVNGDGFADLLIGAYGADPNGQGSGASYVVFGNTTAALDALHGAAGFNLSNLDGNNGFQLLGAAAYDYSGRSVSGAGDVNGDGFADLLVGTFFANPNGSNSSGASYVVFGKASGFAANLNLSSLDGTNGFQLSGETAGDLLGYSVSAAGDVNGDGFGDLLIGAPSADPNGEGSGASYVVFGNTTAALDALHGAAGFNLSNLDGNNGFQLSGETAGDQSGFSVSAAGDVNGDGFGDLLVGAVGADPNGDYSGASYVVFGKASGFAANLNLSSLNGTNGFQLSGAAAGDGSGRRLSGAGDVNGDGFGDLLIGAYRADANGTADSGVSYVMFGKASAFSANLNLSSLNGTNGFRILGAAAYDHSPSSVSAAGDVNGDGFADLLIGAYGADPNGDLSGASYVVFGFNTGQVDFPGTSGDDLLTGNDSANILIGGLGNDTLTGNGGNDRLAGGLGNDTYQVNRDDGQDRIAEHDSTLGNSDRLLYGPTINPLDLVLSRKVNDLRIALHGTTERVTIEDWYSDPTAAQVETIQAGNGQTIVNTQVQQLIDAMAQFTTDTGLSWDAGSAGGGTPEQQAQFQLIIAENWQS